MKIQSHNDCWCENCVQETIDFLEQNGYIGREK